MAIDRFNGENAFLSNFLTCSIVFDPDTKEVSDFLSKFNIKHPEKFTYVNAEQLFQALKTDVKSERAGIQQVQSAPFAKRRGKEVTLRSNWNEIRVEVMKFVVWLKFSQNPDLAKQLLDTKDEELIEGNTWNDTFWGVCRGRGSNHLGKILMYVRSVLRSHSSPLLEL